MELDYCPKHYAPAIYGVIAVFIKLYHKYLCLFVPASSFSGALVPPVSSELCHETLPTKQIEVRVTCYEEYLGTLMRKWGQIIIIIIKYAAY